MNLTHNDIGKRVTFDIYGSSVIGGNYSDVEVLAILSASAVLEYNPRQKHESIVSLLPTPRPQSYNEYVYYLLLMPNNQKAIVGDAWIKPSSLVRGSKNKIQIEVSNVAPSDIGKIRYLLSEAGYDVTSAALITK